MGRLFAFGRAIMIHHMMTPDVLILRDPRESVQKCSLTPLRGREDVEFLKYDPNRRYDAAGRILLHHEGELLSEADAGRGLFLVDSSWRRLPKLLDRVDGEPVRVRFAVPITFRLPAEAETVGQAEPAPRPQASAPEGDPDVMAVVDEQPRLIGGLAGLQERVTYPPLARDAGIEGQVIVQFVVDEQGSVQDAVVLRSPDDMLSEAALRAIREARFEPGRQGGVAVKVRFAVPITFSLPEVED